MKNQEVKSNLKKKFNEQELWKQFSVFRKTHITVWFYIMTFSARSYLIVIFLCFKNELWKEFGINFNVWSTAFFEKDFENYKDSHSYFFIFVFFLIFKIFVYTILFLFPFTFFKTFYYVLFPLSLYFKL